MAPQTEDVFLARGSSRPTCSFCGSVSGDEFMSYVEAGGEVIPTDKNYKAYLGDAPTKVYFQHLSEEQKTRFVELLNASKVKLGEPGHFYVTPFFMRRLPITPEVAANS